MTSERYAIRFVTSADQVPADLWDRCFPPPLEGRWWYEALERSDLEAQFTFLYGIVLEGGQEVGLAPAFLMDVPIELVVPPELFPFFRVAGRVFPSIKYQRTLFVGSPCSDEGTVGLVPEVESRAALHSVHLAIAAKAKALNAPMIVWKDFPDEFAADLDWVADREGLFRLVSFPGAVINLPSGKKDDYYAAMKASRRQKIKRKLRNSTAAVDLSVEVFQEPLAETLDEIFSLFSQTYDKAATKFEQLNKTFFEEIAAKPVSHFILLREKATGKLVGLVHAMLCCWESPHQQIHRHRL